MHLVESVGTGIPRIARILSDDGFPPAEYKTEGFFTTILKKKKTSSTEQAGESKEKNQEKVRRKRRRKSFDSLLPIRVLRQPNLLKSAV